MNRRAFFGLAVVPFVAPLLPRPKDPLVECERILREILTLHNSGGYLIPSEFHGEFIEALRKTDTVRSV